MAKHILITGGTGMIGGALTDSLEDEGYEIAYLSRNSGLHDGIRKYKWDISANFIDPEALHWADVIIHLAGAGVADKKWTESRKKVILESRTHSSKLLFDKLSKENYNVKQLISASAIGYYGFAGEEKYFSEKDEPGDDFLARVTKSWEDETSKFSQLDLKSSRVRIGVVLSNKGGAFKKIKQPVYYFAGAPLGSGKQIVSWIHIDDLVNIFKYIMDNDLEGVYNAVSPNPVSNEKLTKVIGHMMRKPVFLPNVPEFVLKMVFGKMAEIVLKGSKVSSEKIQRAGFKFAYPGISDAVYDLVLRKV